MAWAIKFDGVNDYMTTASYSFSGNSFVTETLIEPQAAMSDKKIFSLDQSTPRNSFILRFLSATSVGFFIRKNNSFQQSGTAVFPASGYGKIKTIANTLTGVYSIEIDDIEVRTGTLSGFVGWDLTSATLILGAETASGGFVTANAQYFKISTDRFYDATPSSHGAGTPILTDTIGGNNATGFNMPTDGSAWLDLGGGGVTVTVDAEAQTQSIEQVTLTQQSSITIGGLTQAQSIEQLTLQASGTLSLNNLEQIQSIEQVNLTQAHVISVNSIDQAQTLGQVTLLVAGTLTVDDAEQTQTLDNVNLTQQSSLVIDNARQAQTLEQTVLSVIASLAVNDITQAQEVEQVIVTAFNGSAVNIASIDQAQNIDTVTLSQLSVVSVDNLSQSQLLQAVNFNGVVVGYLQGALTVISAYNGSIKLTNPLTGEIRIL